MKFYKPYIYFWISALIMFIAGLFTYSDENAIIDINFHDTYFIIHLFYLITLISLLYFIEGGIYWIFKKLKISLINYLIQIHIFCTIGGLLIYFILMTIFEDDTEIEQGVFNQSSIIGWVIIVILCTIIFSQVLFLINIIIGLTKRLIRNKTVKQ